MNVFGVPSGHVSTAIQTVSINGLGYYKQKSSERVSMLGRNKNEYLSLISLVISAFCLYRSAYSVCTYCEGQYKTVCSL